MACHHRTIGQHRRFEVAPIKNSATTIGYVRVSTHGQKDDLKVQENSLREKSTLMGISLDNVISDVGSGINCRKKGLKILISKVLAGSIKHISAVCGLVDQSLAFASIAALRFFLFELFRIP